MGFERGGGGGQILGFSIDLRRRLYNTQLLYFTTIWPAGRKNVNKLKVKGQER